jgi:hypothetical protein
MPMMVVRFGEIAKKPSWPFSSGSSSLLLPLGQRRLEKSRLNSFSSCGVGSRLFMLLQDVWSGDDVTCAAPQPRLSHKAQPHPGHQPRAPPSSSMHMTDYMVRSFGFALCQISFCLAISH